ncbi:hypothetical protein Pelo_8394 [Pelomyxa schiedti]|nr:hypothetical protein Pelo_8394 [Pelomyxa schiedti]
MAQCTQHLTDDVEEVKFNFQVGGDIIEDFRSFSMMGPFAEVDEDECNEITDMFLKYKDRFLAMDDPPPLELAEVSNHNHKLERQHGMSLDCPYVDYRGWRCDICSSVGDLTTPDDDRWHCYKCNFDLCKNCILKFRVLLPSTVPEKQQTAPVPSTSSAKAATTPAVPSTSTAIVPAEKQQEANFQRLRGLFEKLFFIIGMRPRIDKLMHKIKEAHLHCQAQSSQGCSIDKEKVIADILHSMNSSRHSVKEACDSVLSQTLKPELHLEEEVEYTITKNNFRPSLGVVIDLRRRLRKMQAAKEKGKRTKVVKYPQELVVNQSSLVKVHDVVSFLLEMMRRDDALETPEDASNKDTFSLRKSLLLLVENSKWTNRKIEGCATESHSSKVRVHRADRAASTAMTLLLQGKHNFSNADLRHIHINSADLSGGIFGGASMVNADFSDCKMQQVWLCGADLAHCNMTGVSFNERVAFDFGVGLACVDVSADGKRLCACPRNKGLPLLCDITDEDHELKEVGPEVQCNQCKFSPNGKKICFVMSGDQSVLVLDIHPNTWVDVDFPKSTDGKKEKPSTAASKIGGMSTAVSNSSSSATIKSICFSEDSTVLAISVSKEGRDGFDTFIYSLTSATATPTATSTPPSSALQQPESPKTTGTEAVHPQHTLNDCVGHFFIKSSLLVTSTNTPDNHHTFWEVPTAEKIGDPTSTPPPPKDPPTNIGSDISMFALSPTRNKLAGFSKATGKVTVWEFSEKNLREFRILFEHQVSDPQGGFSGLSVLYFSPKGTWLLAGTQLLHVETQNVNCDVAQKCFFTGEDTLGYLGDSQIYEVKASSGNMRVTESWPCRCVATCGSKVLTVTRRPAEPKETDSKKHTAESKKTSAASSSGSNPPQEHANQSSKWVLVHEMWTSDGLKQLPLPHDFDEANKKNLRPCFSSDGKYVAGCDASTVFLWDLSSGTMVQHNNTLTDFEFKAWSFFPAKEGEHAKFGVALTRKKVGDDVREKEKEDQCDSDEIYRDIAGDDTPEPGSEDFKVFCDKDIPKDPNNMFCVWKVMSGETTVVSTDTRVSSCSTASTPQVFSTPSLILEEPIKLPLASVLWDTVVVSPSWKSVMVLMTKHKRRNIAVFIDQETHTITKTPSFPFPSPGFIFPGVTTKECNSSIFEYSPEYDSNRKLLTEKGRKLLADKGCASDSASEDRHLLFLVEDTVVALDLNLLECAALVSDLPESDPEKKNLYEAWENSTRQEQGFLQHKMGATVQGGPWCLFFKGEVAAIATTKSTILLWQLVWPKRCILTLGPFSGHIFSVTASGDNILVVVAGRDIHYIRVERKPNGEGLIATLVHRTGHTMQPLVAANATVQTVKGLTVENKSLLKSRAIIGAITTEREVDTKVVQPQVDKLKTKVWTSAQKPKQMPKFLGLFFSNYSNPRSKKCTAHLAENYESLIREQPKNTFAIIEISCDRSARLFKNNARKDINGWSHLPFDERELQETLVDLFDVTPSEPTIVVLNQSGEMVSKHSVHVLFKDFAHLKFPWSVDSYKWMKFESHKHPLELLSTPEFVCSKCEEGGSGLAYHCHLESQDFHPRCTSGASELPDWITYKGHEHPVCLDQRSSPPVYHCEKCWHNVEITKCLKQKKIDPPPKPNTIFSWSMFEAQETPLQLVFKSGSYQCEQCKKEKEEGGWVYHCPKRDLDFEPSCLGDPRPLSKWLNLECHPHPVKLAEKVWGLRELRCGLCKQPCPDSYYTCVDCEKPPFYVDVECTLTQPCEALPDPEAEPNSWKKFAEDPHPLKMVFVKDFHCCRCDKPGSCWALECKVCKPEGVYFHPQCAGKPRELPNLVLDSGERAHPHPLALTSASGYCESECSKCDGEIKIGQQFYYCKLDEYGLHVRCCLSATELPDVEGKPLTWKKCNQDTHPVQLVLSSGEFTCHHCNKPKPGPAWAYKCHTENVFFHIECLENPQNPQKWIILNNEHKHPLQFGNNPGYLKHNCCVCGSDGDKDAQVYVYFCESCNDWCHVKCTAGWVPPPPMIKIKKHKDPLALEEAASPKPEGADGDGDDERAVRCDKCYRPIAEEQHYKCTKCALVTHVGCCPKFRAFDPLAPVHSDDEDHDDDDDDDSSGRGGPKSDSDSEDSDGSYVSDDSDEEKAPQLHMRMEQVRQATEDRHTTSGEYLRGFHTDKDKDKDEDDDDESCDSDD